MKFADFICPEAIRAELQSTDKEGVIREMTQALVDAGQIAKRQYGSIVKAILRREERGTTAMGRGVAVPHARHPGAKRTIGTVAICRDDADFASLDGQAVHFFILLISPPHLPDDHLKALATVNQQLRNDAVCRLLTQARNAEQIMQLLNQSDA